MTQSNLTHQLTEEAWKEIKLTRNQVTKVDISDFEELSKYKWYAKCANGKFYANYSLPSNGKYINLSMHRHIVNCPKGLVVDHRNGDTLDNRKSNLRICTISENNMNKRIIRRNKSGLRGVFWNKRIKMYISIFHHKRKCIYVGRSLDKYALAQKYNDMVLKFRGEFAYLNVIPNHDYL